MLRQLIISLAAISLTSSVRAEAPDEAGQQFFEAQVRPVLVEQCYRWHGAEAVAKGKLKGGLRADSVEGLLKGGENGPALAPGEPDKSRMIEAVRYTNADLQMPPKRKLSDEQIADL